MTAQEVHAAFREMRAQATMEMAVVTPVLLVLALIVYNLMIFLAASARFDRVAPDIVIAHAASPAGAEDGGGSDVLATIQEQLETAMAGYDIEIEVAYEHDGETSDTTLFTLVGSTQTYRCSFRMQPWPRGLLIAGVEMGAPIALTHARDVTIDPWRAGVVM